MTAERVIVRGEVQRVGFRWFVQSQAEAAGLTGWVCNLADGAVEAHLEGDSAAIERVVTALRKGPPRSQVTAVERTPCAPQRPVGFRIAR
ncbi:MAG: acylphosphatase [Planctomycetota bacterium]|nr:MAG: acylphosphatase [Planctomycetota bacterium]